MLCIDSLFNDYNKLTVVYNYERIFDSFIDSYTGGCCILYYGNAVYKKGSYPTYRGDNSRERYQMNKKFSEEKKIKKPFCRKNFRGKKGTKG